MLAGTATMVPEGVGLVRLEALWQPLQFKPAQAGWFAPLAAK